MTKSFQKDADTIQLQLWDTAGAEKYHSMGQSFYRNSQACILVFDITDAETFKNVETWRTEFLDQLNPSNPNEFPLILLGRKFKSLHLFSNAVNNFESIWFTNLLFGNKSDMKNEMQVSNEAIEKYCKEHNNLPFFLCSAKDNINLDEAFGKVVDMALENSKKNEENFVPDVKNLKLGQAPKKKKKCC